MLMSEEREMKETHKEFKRYSWQIEDAKIPKTEKLTETD